MISAIEARELVKTSEANIDKQLKYLFREIRQKATEGKREFYPPGEEFKPIDKYSPCMNVFQSSIGTELRKLGFTFEIVTIKHPSSPPGLGSMDDTWSEPWNERKIKIGW